MQGKPWEPKDSNADRAEGRAEKNGGQGARQPGKTAERPERAGVQPDGGRGAPLVFHPFRESAPAAPSRPAG